MQVGTHTTLEQQGTVQSDTYLTTADAAAEAGVPDDLSNGMQPIWSYC